MFFFKKKQRQAKSIEIEAQVQHIKARALSKAEDANKATDKLNELLEKTKKEGGITLKLYLATGGDRRIKR